MRPPDVVTKLLEPVMRRIAAFAARGRVTGVDDTKKMQVLQVKALHGEHFDLVERFQQYGLSAVPELDAELVLLCLGGNRDHAIAIAVDDRRHRPTGLAAGEVCVYSKHGQRVLLKSNGDVEITAPGAINVTAATSMHFGVAGTAIDLTPDEMTLTAPFINMNQS